MPNSSAVILFAIMAACTAVTAAGDSLSSRVPPLWWEAAAGLKVVTLKQLSQGSKPE